MVNSDFKGLFYLKPMAM